MIWTLSHRFETASRLLADRHYNRQKVGSPQFVPPGSCVVLRSLCGRAVWVSLYQRAEFVDHAWPGLWQNTLFRNEGAGLSSELIRAAVAATLDQWGLAPAEGMLTFVDPKKVLRKRDPGRCFRRAGFKPIGATKSGLIALRLMPCDMPAPERANGVTAPLFEVVAA